MDYVVIEVYCNCNLVGYVLKYVMIVWIIGKKVCFWLFYGSGVWGWVRVYLYIIIVYLFVWLEKFYIFVGNFLIILSDVWNVYVVKDGWREEKNEWFLCSIFII